MNILGINAYHGDSSAALIIDGKLVAIIEPKFELQSPLLEQNQIFNSAFDQSDENCTVWRLVPSDQARIVLSPPVHDWLEENAQANDQVQITAIKTDNQNIEITLAVVE